VGDNTRYSLEIFLSHGRQPLDPESARQGISALREKNEWAQCALDENGGAEEAQKWYEHEDDLREFSKSPRPWLYVLSGEGEESGDIWKKDFRDGKMQVAKATIQCAPFDEKALA